MLGELSEVLLICLNVSTKLMPGVEGTRHELADCWRREQMSRAASASVQDRDWAEAARQFWSTSQD